MCRNESNQLEITLNPDAKAASYVERIFRSLTLSFHRTLNISSSPQQNNINDDSDENNKSFVDIQIKAVIADSRKGSSEIVRIVKIASPRFDDFVSTRPRPCLLGTPRALKAHHLEKSRSFTMGSSSISKNKLTPSAAPKKNDDEIHEL